MHVCDTRSSLVLCLYSKALSQSNTIFSCESRITQHCVWERWRKTTLNNYEYIREYGPSLKADFILCTCYSDLWNYPFQHPGSRSMSSPFMHNLLYVTVAVREQAQGTSHRISSAYQVGFFKRLLTNSLLLASFLLILSPSLVYIYLCMWKCVCRNDVGICILIFNVLL